MAQHLVEDLSQDPMQPLEEKQVFAGSQKSLGEYRVGPAGGMAADSAGAGAGGSAGGDCAGVGDAAGAGVGFGAGVGVADHACYSVLLVCDRVCVDDAGENAAGDGDGSESGVLLESHYGNDGRDSGHLQKVVG